MRFIIGTSGIKSGGGIGTYVEELTKWLIFNDNDVLICLTSLQKQVPILDYDLYVTIVENKKEDELRAIISLFEVIKNYKPDVIINNDNIYISGLLPSLDSKIIRISVVHGHRDGLGWDHHKIINNAAIYNYRYIDWIIAISKYMANSLKEKRFIPLNQVHTIYNGILPKNESFVSFNRRLKYKTIKILFAGGGKREKGAKYLYHALKKKGPISSDIKIYWAGNLPQSGLFSFNNLNKLPNTEVYGLLAREELLDLLSECHYLLMPSLAEGCPMLLLEAMSLGVVPIVSDCHSAMMEIVNDGKCGHLIKERSSDSIRKFLLSISENHVNWENFATKALEYFNKNLHIDILGNKIMELSSLKRQGINDITQIFPPKGLISFHRRKYEGSKLSLRNLLLRYNNITGRLKKL